MNTRETPLINFFKSKSNKKDKFLTQEKNRKKHKI